MCVLPGEVVTSSSEYRAGMDTCVGEVMRVLTSSNVAGADPELKTRLIDHLATKLCSPASPSDSVKSQNCSRSLKSPKLKSPHTNTANAILSTSLEGNEMEDSGGADSTTQQKDTLSPPSSVNQMSMALPVTSSTFSCVHTDALSSNTMLVSGNSGQVLPPQANYPSVPLTILVPANFCNQLGATCVIPIAFTGTSSSPVAMAAPPSGLSAFSVINNTSPLLTVSNVDSSHAPQVTYSQVTTLPSGYERKLTSSASPPPKTTPTLVRPVPIDGSSLNAFKPPTSQPVSVIKPPYTPTPTTKPSLKPTESDHIGQYVSSGYLASKDGYGKHTYTVSGRTTNARPNQGRNQGLGLGELPGGPMWRPW